jgi:thiol-disulfide isomerase/thioredoxin
MSIKVHHVVNGLSILLAVWIGWTLLQRFISRPQEAPSAPAVLSKGHPLPLHGVNWDQNGETLLLLLSPTCHYCNLSVPLYSALSQHHTTMFRIIAVFEADPTASEEYLTKHQIAGVSILQASFGNLGVSATPTLILVDHNGKVDKAWVGFLDATRRGDLLGRMGMQETADSTDTHIQLIDVALPTSALHLTDASAYLKERDNARIVIDTRDISTFNRRHLEGAHNIPLDELETRAPHEVKTSERVALFCQYCGPCENNMYVRGLFTSCTLAKHIFNKLGYNNLEILSDDLDSFREHGVTVASTK